MGKYMLWKISPSSLTLFEDCPRCFWLYIRERQARPSIPVAKITEGMDRVIKAEEGDVLFRGKLDECLVDGQGRFLPFDFKTKGDVPREDAFKYYVTQLESYGWLLERNGYPAGQKAYLMYVYPKAVEDNMAVDFGATLQEVAIKPQRITGLLNDAVALLSSPAPPRHSACQFCAWVEHTHPL